MTKAIEANTKALVTFSNNYYAFNEQPKGTNTK